MGSAGIRLQFIPVLLPPSWSVGGGGRRSYLHTPAWTWSSKVSVIIFLSPGPSFILNSHPHTVLHRQEEKEDSCDVRKKSIWRTVNCLLFDWVFLALRVIMIAAPLLYSFCSNIE